MIERLENFPDEVVAFSAKGRVTKRDYEQVLIPNFEAALHRHRKIRLYYELGPQFTGIDPGALWEDLKTGVEHFNSWDRMAIVTETEWIKHALNAFRFLLPGQLRVFPITQTAEARAWIVSAAA